MEIGGTEGEFLSQFGLLLLFSLLFSLAVLQPLCMSTFVETLRWKKKKVKRMEPWMGLGLRFLEGGWTILAFSIEILRCILIFDEYDVILPR